MSLTEESVTDLQVPRTPALSPDVEWVAYTTSTIGQPGEAPVSGLWIVPADGRAQPRSLTAGPSEISDPRWTPDSRWIVFRDCAAQLYRVGAGGGAAEQLTVWRSDIHDHIPLADPNLIALIAEDEPTEDDERRSTERDDAVVCGERIRLHRLRLLDLQTLEIHTPDAFVDQHVVAVSQRPDGGPLAVLTWATPSLDPGALAPRLHLLHLDTGATQDLGPAGVDASSPLWWEGDSAWHIAYLGYRGLVGGAAVFDVVPGHDHTNLTAGLTICPMELVATSAAPMIVFADGMDTAIRRLDPTNLRFTELLAVENSLTHLTASGDLVAGILSTSNEPWDVVAGPPRGPLMRLTDMNPQLRGITWGTTERLSFRASGGPDVEDY